MSACEERPADGVGSFSVGVIVALQNVREEEELEDEEEDEEFDDDEQPQLATHGHGAESIDVEAHYPLWDGGESAQWRFGVVRCWVLTHKVRRMLVDDDTTPKPTQKSKNNSENPSFFSEIWMSPVTHGVSFCPVRHFLL